MARKKAQKSTYHSVMLVDDNEIDNFINEKMIEGCGFADQVYIHTSSKSALELLKNFERGSGIPREMIPSVIFLDINMPIMDGFQFIGEFEQLDPALRDQISIVLLTTSINPSDEERGEKNPYIKKFMNKPLTQEHLDELAAVDAQM